jgi:hypothetical protein
MNHRKKKQGKQRNDNPKTNKEEDNTDNILTQETNKETK